MIKSKKGAIFFVPLLVMMTFVILVYAAVLFQMEKPITKQTVGEISASLVKKYNEGEKFLFYVDKSAEYAAYDTVYGLAGNGGVKESEKCKKKAEYYVWDKDCKPSKENFAYYFEKNFMKYIGSAYPGAGLKYGYEMESKDGKNKLIGLSKGMVNLVVENKVERVGYGAEESYAYDIAKAGGYSELINKYAKINNIDPVVLKCIVRQESNFNERAISNCGAAGLMQLMPGTAKENGIKNVFNNVGIVKCDNTYANDLKEAIHGKSNEELIKMDERFDAEKNIMAGSLYFNKMLKMFGNVDVALAAYNAGPGNMSKHNVFVDSKFKETQNYVRKITSCIYEENSGEHGKEITDEAAEEIRDYEGSSLIGGAFDEDENVVDVGVYEPTTSFLVEFDYDFSDYDKVYFAVNEKMECLKDEYEKCFKDDLGMNWNLKKDGDLIFIEATTNQKIERFNIVEDNNVVIKFGVDLKNWEKPGKVISF